MVVEDGPREGVVIPALGGVALGPERPNEGPSLRASIRLRISEMLGRVLAPELRDAEGGAVLDGRRKVDPGRCDELLRGLLNEGLDRSPDIEGALGLLGPLREVPKIRRSRSKSGRPADELPDDSEPLDPRPTMLGRISEDRDDGRSIVDGVERDVDGEDGRRRMDDGDGEDGREGRVI
jgi:hypothetical protein